MGLGGGEGKLRKAVAPFLEGLFSLLQKGNYRVSPQRAHLRMVFLNTDVSALP